MAAGFDSPGVVITGLGLVLPQGTGLPSAEAVFDGRSAVDFLPGQVGIPEATGAAAVAFVPPPGTASLDRAVQFAVAAAEEAWDRSGLSCGGVPADRVATVISLSKGGLFAMARWAANQESRAAKANRGQHGQPRCPALSAPAAEARSRAADGRRGASAMALSLPDAAARAVAGRLGLAGPMNAPITACASGGHALAWGATLIRRGVVDAAIVGAAEASLHPIVLGSYRRMGVLAPAGDNPETSVRPFSATRRGFAIGEGAGVLVLESAASAQRRGSRPLAGVCGWAAGCQPAGLTEMEPGGKTLAEIIRRACVRAGVSAAAVDFVHAHGTATAANDLAEASAIRSALGRAAGAVSISSTKGSHGHLLGAAASVELVLTVLAIERGLVPPTANLTDPDPAIGLDCTPLRPRRRAIRCALKIASGFGGQVLAVVLSAPP
jgi:3-oxoacyl-(acyl-carrier-protein) synthase